MGADFDNLAANYEYQDEPCIQEYISDKNENKSEIISKTKKNEVENNIPIPNRKSSYTEGDSTIKEIKSKNSPKNSSDRVLYPKKKLSYTDTSAKIKEIFYNNNDNYSEYTQCSSSNSLDNLLSEIKKKSDAEYYVSKSSEDIRKNFMAKLIYKNVWQKSKNYNSIIIFDWDDTLLPTSYLRQEKLFFTKILPDKEKEKLKILENTIYKILEMAISKGEVYIITNSGMGWIEYSARKFYPKLLEILDNVHIISARNEYEDEFPGDAREWKVQTFLNIKNKMNNKLVTNIICLGDSSEEIEAGKILATQFLEAYIKTVKFKENPIPLELNKQLELVANQFNYIYSSTRNLSIKVGKKSDL